MKTKVLQTITYILLSGLAFGQSEYVKKLPLVSIELECLSENGVPIDGVNVKASDHMVNLKDQFRRDTGKSGKNGKTSLQLRALSVIGVCAEKAGYYPSIAPAMHERPIDERFRFDPFVYREDIPRIYQNNPPMKKEVKLEASITLREIKNPIPLYVKAVRMDIPVRDVWLGYDFEVGDWVKPHGKGIKSDMRVRSAPKKLDPGDPNKMTLLPGVATLEIDFGEDGGIIRVTKDNGWLAVSEMKMPHLAPEAGYDKLPMLEIKHTTFEDSSELEKIPGNNEYLLQKANGYFFRTRVRRDGEKIVSANYGKIMGSINYIPVQRDGAWWGDEKENAPAFGSIEFTYYFNPASNDRNLEFDVKENLFKRSDQWIREP